MEIKGVSRLGSRGWESCLLVFLMVGTIFILGWLLNYANYGLEFSDEGYYLVWMSNPFNYDWSITQFGFIYHPLYLLLNGDIARLRQVNILVVFFLAWFLINTLFKKSTYDSAQVDFQRLALSAGFAVVSLAYFAPWIPTPSYNSLGLQAMLIVASGLLLAEVKRTSSSILGWVLIGLGGWLAFMAKPPLAAAMGVCAITYILLSRKLNLNLLLLSLGVVLVLLVSSALAIDGSVAGFISRLRTGVEFSALVGAGYSLSQIFRVDEFSLSHQEFLVFCTLVVTSFFVTYFVCASNIFLKVAGVVLSGLFLAFCISTICGERVYSLSGGAFQGLIIWAVPLGTIAFGVISYFYKARFKLSGAQCALSLIFVVFPHAFAFGTNGNYWQVGSYAGIFWVLAGLVFISGSLSNRHMRIAFFPLALIAQIITVLLLQTGLENPYRQAEALRLNHSSTEVGQPGSLLFLSDGYANYVNEAVEFASTAGFESGTPIIDLTGQSPTLLYALRAESIGYPWIAGGYPGSLEVAKLGLRRVPCGKLASAWLLLEPDGPRALSGELLKDSGINLSEHYQVVASWDTAEGAGSYKIRRHQQLLKPLRSGRLAAQACEILREGT
ncbi:hypothetical protein [Pseudomonas sp. G(2018)]|uniref:hypothetical protein n=1 Tax=Pseudomonas sp. G(2018) TaxID=2502242 RepID=UPI0010F68CC0|nr:hypothetical protein [Pseudomonas sp. G(2018)]